MNKILVGTVLLVGLPILLLKFRDCLGAALIFLLGVIVVSDSLWNWKFEEALRAYGEEAVVSPAGDSYTKITRRSSEKIRMTVRFRTRQGREILDETELPAGVLEKLLGGDRVTVSYLPSKPVQYRFNPWQPNALQDLKFGALMMAIAAAWIFAKRRTGRKPAPVGDMDSLR